MSKQSNEPWLREYKRSCADCGVIDDFTITNEKTTFTYGSGDSAYDVEMVLPVHNCNNCGRQSTTKDAWAVETAAVYKYMKENA